MNETEYLKQMILLSDKLLQVSKARPYDPVAYNAIIDELNNTKCPNHERRRRRPWMAFCVCIMLLIVLVWIVFEVLCVLYMKGPK